MSQFTSAWLSELQARQLSQAREAWSAAMKDRPPTRLPAAEREAGLHQQIFLHCRQRQWISLHGSMASATGRTLGEPDFVILADGGRTFYIECKSRVGKLSPTQFALAHHAERLGHKVHVVRSFAEYQAVVGA